MLVHTKINAHQRDDSPNFLMNPSCLKALFVLAILILSTQVSFTFDTDDYRKLLENFASSTLLFLMAIHTFPILPSEKLYSVQKDHDMDSHKNNVPLDFKFSSEADRSFAIYSLYLGGTFAQFITIFTSKYSAQKYYFISSIFFFLGGIISGFSKNWDILALGRFILGMGIGVGGKVNPIPYNNFIMALHDKPNAKAFDIIYRLMVPGGILLCGFLQEYFLNKNYARWRFVYYAPAAFLAMPIVF